MNADELRIFIELNGYDPTTKQGLCEHLAVLRAKLKPLKEAVLATPSIANAAYAETLMLIDALERAIARTFEALGRLEFDKPLSLVADSDIQDSLIRDAADADDGSGLDFRIMLSWNECFVHYVSDKVGLWVDSQTLQIVGFRLEWT